MSFKPIRKIFFACALFFIISIPHSFSSITCCASEIVTPYADVYIYKYRTKNGVLQKRLWNDTKRVWAEPYWHSV